MTTPRSSVPPLPGSVWQDGYNPTVTYTILASNRKIVVYLYQSGHDRNIMHVNADHWASARSAKGVVAVGYV